jgi:acetylornithine/LysW-gamma-L-lysine aminotransferase
LPEPTAAPQPLRPRPIPRGPIGPPPAADDEFARGSGAYAPRGITLDRGEGSVVFDADGRRYLDCIAGHGAAILGHAQPVLTAALAAQADQLINAPASFAHPVRAAALERLAAFTGYERFFLCSSGTEAIEGVIKIARLTTGRSRIVAFRRAFHGRTLGALSATWNPKLRKPFEPLLEDVVHLSPENLEGLAAIDEQVAAVLIEPVQGEGGVHPIAPEFYRAVRAACARAGALLAADEVQTGFGRTGRRFAHEHFSAADPTLRPDLLALAKGIAGGVPMGAIAMSALVPPLPAGAHGSTFGGNLLACAACVAILQVLEQGRWIEHAAALGAIAREVLDEALGDDPRVREIRGIGLMWGIELRGKLGTLVRDLAERGVLALSSGIQVLRLLPPLVITESEWREVLDRVVQAIRALHPPASRPAREPTP